MDKELTTIWAAIESWPITPSLKGGSIFNAGASLTEIQEFEKNIGVNLPQDIIDSYLRHDGMPPENGYYCFWEGNFLSLQQSLKAQQERSCTAKEIFGDYGSAEYLQAEMVQGPVKPARWLPLWIPILKKNKEYVCIDFDPAPEGLSGQIIEIDWEGCAVEVIASSYRTFLEKVVAQL